MIARFCCCPECGECSAAANEGKKDEEITRLRARVGELEQGCEGYGEGMCKALAERDEARSAATHAKVREGELNARIDQLKRANDALSRLIELKSGSGQ